MHKRLCQSNARDPYWLLSHVGICACKSGGHCIYAIENYDKVGIKVASELVDSSRKRMDNAAHCAVDVRATSKVTVSATKEKKKHN